jgi:hypothetical protein
MPPSTTFPNAAPHDETTNARPAVADQYAGPAGPSRVRIGCVVDLWRLKEFVGDVRLTAVDEEIGCALGRGQLTARLGRRGHHARSIEDACPQASTRRFGSISQAHLTPLSSASSAIGDGSRPALHAIADIAIDLGGS